MKRWNSLPGCRDALLLVAAAVLLSGCASATHKKSNAAADRMRIAAREMAMEAQSIEATTAALEDLMKNPASDLRQQYASFDAALERLYDSVERTDNAVIRMDGKGAAYFKDWEEQLEVMNYDAIRDRSAARKDEVNGQYQDIRRRYYDTREVVLPLLAYFEDIRKALSADLTAGGLEAVRDVAANAAQNARKVSTAVGQLTEDFSALGNRMSSVAFVPVEKTARGSAVDLERAEMREP